MLRFSSKSRSSAAESFNRPCRSMTPIKRTWWSCRRSHRSRTNLWRIWLADGSRQPNLTAGQAYRWTIPESLPVDGWKLSGPDGISESIRANESRTFVVEAREPGAYVADSLGIADDAIFRHRRRPG